MATTKEQLRRALIEQARLLEQLRKAKKKRKSGGGWKPPFDGAHRGY